MIPLSQQVREAKTGAKILRDWLGSGGKPVPIEQAQARANICITCPHNDNGQWRWTTMAAIGITRVMAWRKEHQRSLTGEDKLHTCSVCGCHLKIKMDVPFSHIYRHTTDAEFSRFPEFCWLRKELAEYKKGQ